ncbi:MAG: hypothetical protein LBD20_03510 [Spirochaetaceae bacterium]|jgi:hypothetical protein|nr:hypothetical protein [Spirochaetaceae bacterium]
MAYIYIHEKNEKFNGVHKLLFFFLLLFFVCASHHISAQNISRLALYSAKGEKFSIAYNGQTRVYRPEPLPSGGISIQNKDYIQTKDNSVVEIRSNPGGMMILIADNSQVRFESAGGNSSLQVITLIFGRIRIINTLNNQSVIVRAGRTVIEAGSGDINIDYARYPWVDDQVNRTLVISTIKDTAVVTVPAQTKQTVIKKDNGSVEVKGNAKKKRSTADEYQINMSEGETLYIDPIMMIAEKRSLYDGLETFWLRKGYAGFQSGRQPAGFIPDISEAPAVHQSAVEKKPYNDPAVVSPDAAPAAVLDPAPKKKSKAGLKVLGIVGGSLLAAGGLTVQYGLKYIAPPLVPDRNTENTYFVAGFIPLGLGIITIIGSIIQ